VLILFFSIEFLDFIGFWQLWNAIKEKMENEEKWSYVKQKYLELGQKICPLIM